MAGRRYETDVLVAGGDPVGLALGLELTLHGVDFIVAGTGDPTHSPAVGTHPDGAVRPHWRLDSLSSYENRVEARIADLAVGDDVSVSAQYVVVCDGTRFPPAGANRSGDPVPATAVTVDYRQGRVFRCGEAAHSLPAAEDHNREVGVADAGNLGWKLAAVLRGWGSDGLLDSYRDERRPVAEAMAAGPDDSRLSHRYRSSVLADDAADPDGLDESLPGLPAPHVWLGPGVSTQDLASDGFTLLYLVDGWSPRTDTPHPPGIPALRQAFSAAGVPFLVVECRDSEIARRYRRPFVLLRPDGYVAWRGWRAPADPAALVELVRGAAPRHAADRSPVAVAV